MTKAKTHHTAHHGAEVVTVTQKSTAEGNVSKYLPDHGRGFIPSPSLIAAGVAGIQIKMLSEIAKVYGVLFSENRAKSIVVSAPAVSPPPASAA